MTMHVRSDNCIACEACVAYCPMDAISMVDGVAVIDQDRCVECGMCGRAANAKGLFRTPCSRACPAGVDVPRYVQHIAQGNPAAALQVIRERIPFPSVCGLVCFHPCEANCARGRLDEPVAIRMLKRFASEHAVQAAQRTIPDATPPSGRSVAIVGSGPAGLTAACYLAKTGHSVVVYEALDEPGGMMYWGIPEYRLPRSVLASEIQDIERAGVVIRTGQRVNSISRLFKEGHDAVFVALGAHRSLRLGIPGEELPGVITAVRLLGEVRRGNAVAVGEEVAVIGGGNSAIEAARTAWRLGAKNVTIYYRRSQAAMPSTREAYEEAVAEGIRFRFFRAPVRVTREANRLALHHVETAPGAPDGGGRPTPVAVRGAGAVDIVDTVITAIGQVPDVPGGLGLRTSEQGLIEVDPDSLSTSMPGVFAGGDAVTGPASVIAAIAHGRRAAIAIDRYLGGPGRIDEMLAPAEGAVELREAVAGQRRCRIPLTPVEQRAGNFRQVEPGIDGDVAMREAARCLRCDLRERQCIQCEPSDWPRALRNHFSQAGVAHDTTGIAGRGTEEMKTNDVTGRFRHGVVGLGLDVGRPCVGASFHDVDMLTRSLAKLGVDFEPNNPITMMMEDVHTGALPGEILDERVLSCVVEASFPMERLVEILDHVRHAAESVETVVSVCCINIADSDGTYELQRRLDELGIPYRKNGKQNAGLGRPRASV